MLNLLGRFVPSSCPQKEYCYQTMVGEKYVQWSVWNGSPKPETNLVYIGASYHSPVSVTERRNLVYNFRSLLATDRKGHLLAGVYFKAAPQSMFTLFCDDDQDSTIKHRIKVPSAKFITLHVKKTTFNIKFCPIYLNFNIFIGSR